MDAAAGMSDADYAGLAGSQAFDFQRDLTQVEFGNDDRANLLSNFAHPSFRERPNGDQPHAAHTQALFPGHHDSALSDARRDAIGNDGDIGVVEIRLIPIGDFLSSQGDLAMKPAHSLSWEATVRSG